MFVLGPCLPHLLLVILTASWTSWKRGIRDPQHLVSGALGLMPGRLSELAGV